MLVLTRKEGETIVIGDNIEVTIVSLDRGHAKVGIKAPRNISVDREEIRERKKQERHANDNFGNR